MMQSLHIFRKDLRHLWPELSVYALLLVAFALVVPQTWPGAASSNTLLQTFEMLLKILIPISWLVLITRVVHEECLIGEEQFWITRPYHWGSLLGAKCIFIVTCLILPFVVMQWSLLFQADINPFVSISGMMLCLLKFCLIVWLPFTLVASLTSTLSAAFMSLAGVTVIWAGLLMFLDPVSGTRMAPPFVLEGFAFTFAILQIGTLIYQFSTRRTARSRIAVVATLFLFLILIYGFVGTHFGTPVRALIRNHYPASSDPSLRLAFVPGPLPYGDRNEDVQVPRGFVEVKLPIHLEGLDPNYKLRDTNISFVIETPGFRYDSPWESATVGEGNFSFLVPLQVFNRTATADAHIHLEFLAEQLRPKEPQIISSNASFSAPNNGRCVLTHGAPVCRYAYQTSVPTRVKALSDSGACGAPGSAKPTFTIFRLVPAGTNPDPVVQEVLGLGSMICAGSPLTFSEYSPAETFRLELDVPSVNIGQYKSR
jgi:hypothetical protein